MKIEKFSRFENAMLCSSGHLRGGGDGDDELVGSVVCIEDGVEVGASICWEVGVGVVGVGKEIGVGKRVVFGLGEG
jgi:hypothetical protein